jgi:small subunit ribosomal protein S17
MTKSKDAYRKQKEKIGIVTSNKMNGLLIVSVDKRIRHKQYKKVITKTYRYAVDNRVSKYFTYMNPSVGDQVLIRETKPFSKTKSWALVRILRKQLKNDTTSNLLKSRG